MANEHLQRIPTSSGNKSTYTWSGWIKRSNLGDWERLFSTAGQTMLQITGSNPPDQLRYFHQLTGNFDMRSTALLRDVGSWMHIVFSVDHTHQHSKNRVRIYINGAEVDNYATDSSSNGSQNLETYFNDKDREHALLGREDSSAGENFRGEAFDIFWVDGQALTPEVFGFYKDGDGYQSSGSTIATDFRPGQWSPRLPKSIKHRINRSGGFGVNGFYLPLNDGSNFGADFHCTPNSIIKLKGEDEPQPRNGAPTTSDAFVSQLRTDPFAANLVLAVPGTSIASPTGSNLISNGTFNTNTTDWNSLSSATLSVVDGKLRVTNSIAAYGKAEQEITTEAGKRYIVSLDSYTGTTTDEAQLRVGSTSNGADLLFPVDVPTGNHIFSFTATGTSSYINVNPGGNVANEYSEFDNIVVKQERVLDYSADIKGSGTNKTLTANGNAGVGYEIPSHYGSALSFDGSGDYFSRTYDADFNFGTSDFTVEMWVYPNTVNSIDGLFAVSGGSGSNPKMAFHLDNGTPSVHYNNLTGASNIYTASGDAIPAGQWSHLAYEREGSTWTWYVNGVATGTGSNSTDITFTNQPMYIGYGGEGFFNSLDGKIQDLRVYKGVAKYKGGFDVPNPYSPQDIATRRATVDSCKNNFVTMNSNNKSGCTLSNGNLTTADATSNSGQIYATMGSNTGKWYYEVHITDVGGPGGHLIGINPLRRPFGNVQNRTVYRSSGDVYNDSGSIQQSGTTYTTGDIIGVAWDADAKKLWFAKNGSWVYSGDPVNGGNQATAYTSTETQGPFVAYDNGNISQVTNFNFGQNPTFSGQVAAGTNTDGNGIGLFKYAPPTGFLALCDNNLPTPAVADPGKHFKVLLYDGNNDQIKSVVGAGFAPDFVWQKDRIGDNWHRLTDVIRGNNTLYSNSSNAQAAAESNGHISSLDSDGFTVNRGSGPGDATNGSGQYVGWCWKAGGPAVTNNDGSATSLVSANQEAGFSIVKFTAQTSGSITLGHGLGKKPAFWLWKDINGATGWYIFHKNLGSSAWVNFDNNDATTGNSAAWGTDPTDTVFTNGSGFVNQNDVIMYIWAEIEGYSKFAQYFGNGDANGPFVYCGFKPAWLLVKCVSADGGHWIIYDSSRSSKNVNGLRLGANLNDSENKNVEKLGTDASQGVDFLSNGFKIRTPGINHNNNGEEYIFAAFAESPFQTANAK